MAGPYNLNPGQIQGGIPTWHIGRQTRVIVTNTTGTVGRLQLMCGLNMPEDNYIQPGTTNFDRDFGGLPLKVTNEGPCPLTVATH
jgi:hypothetical protein